MTDQTCIEFLRWCLPRMQYRWEGFRKVRKQVCKRVHRRRIELKLSDLSKYQKYLKENEEEWGVLDSLCNITISRFYRDRDVFDTIQNELYLQLVGYSNKHNENELVDKLKPAGYLIIGAHESLPEWNKNHRVYKKARSIYQKMIVN